MKSANEIDGCVTIFVNISENLPNGSDGRLSPMNSTLFEQ